MLVDNNNQIKKQTMRKTQSVGGGSTKDCSKDDGSFSSTGQKYQRKAVINLKK